MYDKLVYQYVESNNIKELNELLKKIGSNHVVYRDDGGFSALHIAAINDQVECFEFLLQSNIDKNCIDFMERRRSITL